jgi:hypothetical protein
VLYSIGLAAYSARQMRL